MRAGRFLGPRAAAPALAPALVLALGLAAGGCSRPGWLRAPDLDMPKLPDVDLPSLDLPRFGSDEAPEAAPAADSGVEVLEASPELEFHQRASRFYERLAGRRFNSLATYRDPTLREFFETPESFSDYFADLAQDLAEANFERNQPLAAEVEEFAVDAPGRARVRVWIGGENGLPLRFWSTRLEREDRWERRGGRWWIVPGAGEPKVTREE
ncbi:MAG: hypothetical protein OZ948_12920 [Deltaproteobacteria bacterium]|nr:hypothetical protein [Deltaproteobacteria bacterium]